MKPLHQCCSKEEQPVLSQNFSKTDSSASTKSKQLASVFVARGYKFSLVVEETGWLELPWVRPFTLIMMERPQVDVDLESTDSRIQVRTSIALLVDLATWK